MNKNVMMRVASIMLVLVLMSSSVISGTFAKYVTSGASTDTARVAAFGVVVAADYSHLFEREYTTTDAWAGDDNVSVKSVFGGDLVAPGTNGDLADFTVTGTPEVDVAVTYTPTLTIEGSWLADTDGDGAIDDEYCPIIFNVNGVLYYIGKAGAGIDNIAALKLAVENAIKGAAQKYNAGTDLSAATAVADDLAVSWMWQFDANTTGFVAANNQNDTDDTTLGNWHKNGLVKPQITLAITCTVTQID